MTRPALSCSLLLLLLLLVSPLEVLAVTTFGANFIQYNSTGVVAVSYNTWVSSAITVSGFPVTYFGSTTQVTLTMALTDTNSEHLQVILLAPGGWGSVIGWNYQGATTTCTKFYSTTVADGQTYQTVFQGSGSIPCPPTIMTADANILVNIVGPISNQTLYQFNTPQTSPFMETFTGNPVNGKWQLLVYSTGSSDTGSIASWSLKMYSKAVCSVSLF